MHEAPTLSDEAEVLLFYCYESLGAERAAALAAEQRSLGERLELCGRILVAHEGINGTVQGLRSKLAIYEAAVEAAFVGRAIDWKRSAAPAEPIFPDLAVKEVTELVGFGLQDPVPLDVHSEAGIRLSPAEFHSRLSSTCPEELRIIDVRNTFEYEVGHMAHAIDPGMTHTAQWPKFVNSNLDDLKGRTVMLYCTGGIRCEKASAYLRRKLKDVNSDADTSVFQLEGGIHRYLETYPDGGNFQGANFVFDKRRQMRSGDGTVVGRCSECSSPWDQHHGGRVCCVCRSLVLVCDVCDATSKHGEYYCAEHNELRGFYFHFVDRFSIEELQCQEESLQANLAKELGTHRKNRRNTLRKKLGQVQNRLLELRSCHSPPEEMPRRCRACEKPYSTCPGSCWGFWKADGPLQ